VRLSPYENQEAAAVSKKKPSDAVAIISYDEKPGIQAIACCAKQELKDRIMTAMDFFNHDVVIHTWTYKLDKAA
jgi:hypothetical protein